MRTSLGYGRRLQDGGQHHQPTASIDANLLGSIQYKKIEIDLLKIFKAQPRPKGLKEGSTTAQKNAF